MTEVSPGARDSGESWPPPLPPGPPPPGYVPLGQVQAAPFRPPHRVEAVTAGAPPFTRHQAWRWLLWAVFGFVAAQLLGAVVGEVAGVIAGKTSAQMNAIVHASVPPEWYVVSSLAGIWMGFVGAPWLASRTAGTRRFLHDIGLRFRWIDLPFGLAVGVVGQLAIAAMYAPFQHDISNYDAPTQKITGGSHGGGVLLILLATALLAPFAEEVFFRGLLFKGLLRVFGVGGGEAGVGVTSGAGRVLAVAAAVVIDGLLFGLAHAEWVQLAGLAFFGMVLAVVSYRTGRLGMNIVAHASFNMFAVLAYLYGVVH